MTPITPKRLTEEELEYTKRYFANYSDWAMGLLQHIAALDEEAIEWKSSVEFWSRKLNDADDHLRQFGTVPDNVFSSINERLWWIAAQKQIAALEGEISRRQSGAVDAAAILLAKIEECDTLRQQLEKARKQKPQQKSGFHF